MLLAVLASLLACPSMASAFPSFKLESRSRVDCGSQQVFQRNFQMVVRGKPIPCGQARRISSGKCKIRFKHRWSCFSFPAPGSVPGLVSVATDVRQEMDDRGHFRAVPLCGCRGNERAVLESPSWVFRPSDNSLRTT